MTPAELGTLIDYLNRTGVIGLLVFILIGSVRRWWVPGGQYDDQVERTKAAERDRDEWKFLALTGTQVARKAITSLASRK